MLGLYVTVPIACWRKGAAREYLETEPLPPPATCYGFLLSWVGEEDRLRHRGVRVTAGLLNAPARSTVLRHLWRVKNRRVPLGTADNARPDYQQLLLESELVIWCDSREEPRGPGEGLEARVRAALSDPGSVARYGGLSLGESTHLVNDVRVLRDADLARAPRVFLLDEEGDLSLPVWVDHVGSAGTRHVRGRLEPLVRAPASDTMPRIVGGAEPA